MRWWARLLAGAGEPCAGDCAPCAAGECGVRARGGVCWVRAAALGCFVVLGLGGAVDIGCGPGFPLLPSTCTRSC